MSEGPNESNWHYVDAHFHLDLFQNPHNIADEITSKGIYSIAMTNAPSVFNVSSSLAPKNSTIRTALGFHPQLIESRKNEISLFRELINETKYVGEIGLDFSKEYFHTKSSQLKIFNEIVLTCEDSGNKIISIHSRKSADTIIEIFNRPKTCKAILHWFSGIQKTLEKAIDNGFYFSINPAMAKSLNGQQIIKKIPLDKLLTESDGPFIQNQQSPYSPLDIPILVNHLAKMLAMDINNLGKQIWMNFKYLLLETQ